MTKIGQMASPLPDAATLDARKDRARAWFEHLRDDICAAFEAVEDALPAGAPLADRAAGRFKRTPWQRTDHTGSPGGGGVMAMMHGRVFEKVGVHCSTVHGEFAPGIPQGNSRRRRRSPLLGVRHLADRASAQSAGAGGAHEHALRGHQQGLVRRRRRSHAGARPPPHAGRSRHAAPSTPRCKPPATRTPAIAPYDKFKNWCDEYFFLKHRNEMRGIGGIFYDYLETDWDATFAFTQDVGRAFLKIYPELVRANFTKPWTEADRDEQLVRRGRYVEFNLLYDRGTIFGLRTGGNVDSILSSMPPVVKWP